MSPSVAPARCSGSIARRNARSLERLTADIIELAQQYGRYGYRKVAGLLRQAGWIINDKRVERIWRREGLKVPHKQPKRGRLWLTDGSCKSIFSLILLIKSVMCRVPVALSHSHWLGEISVL